MSPEDDIRIRALENSAIRVEERLSSIQHDVKNARTMINTVGATAQVRHDQLELDIKELSRILFRTGMSLVASVVTILVSIIAYFLVQKDGAFTQKTIAAPQEIRR